MTDRQLRILESYQRALNIAAPRTAEIAPEAAAIVERLTRTLAEIEQIRLEQALVRNARDVSSARASLEAMRARHLMPLARLARRVFAGEPRVQAALRIPHKRATTDVLLAAAELMVRTLRPLRSQLKLSSIDPMRVDRLHAETRRLKQVFKTAYEAAADRAVPTRRLPALFASARMDVQALDALIAARGRAFSDSSYAHARRIGKRIGRPRAKRQAAA